MKRSLLPFLVAVLVLTAPGISAASDAKALYSATCVACHGADGKGAIPGVPDLGPRMTMTDADLINSILKGMQTKGMPLAMPAKGGNPALTAADAAALVVYLRTQLLAPQGASRGSAPATAPAAQAPPPDEHSPAPAASPTADIPVQAAAPNADAAAQALAPPADMARFARGAKAWGEHCASCHSMRDPKDFSDKQWRLITTHMRLRAGMDGADIRDINAFLTGSN